MRGKELIKKAINLETLQERVPWVPFVGCHAGKLIGKTAEEYHKSEQLMIQGLEESIRLYDPDGIPVLFDLQLEAEILGCDLLWNKETPPCVISHPLKEGKTISDLKIPQSNEGRLPLIANVCREIRIKYPELALYGLITGPFTLAMHLYGSDLFMEMFSDNGTMQELMEFCKKVCFKMSRFYMDLGCDIIALVDPMTSQIGPDHFLQFISEPVTEIFKFIQDQNCLSSFFVCGQAQQNIEVMADCSPDNISIDENIPLDYVRDICLEKGISFGGNLQLTVTLLLGSKEDCERDAVDCLTAGGKKGFILAPGCDLPFDTPIENLRAVAQLVGDEYRQEVVKTLKKPLDNDKPVTLKDYENSKEVTINIITLDSESCAPCQYMVDAVRKVAPEFGESLCWQEHKIKQKESIQLMKALNVRDIPSICIDGEVAFSSRIPPKNVLIETIQNHLDRKKK